MKCAAGRVVLGQVLFAALDRLSGCVLGLKSDEYDGDELILRRYVLSASLEQLAGDPDRVAPAASRRGGQRRDQEGEEQVALPHRSVPWSLERGDLGSVCRAGHSPAGMTGSGVSYARRTGQY